MMAGAERMPPLDPAVMNEAQRKAAQVLAAGPRRGVKGPFIALLRSPELMDRLQKVGEYLRFQSALPVRVSELMVLLVARQWTQQFEWFVHVPLALDAGVKPEAIAGLADRRRPAAMATDEEIAYDFCNELVQRKGVAETTYRIARTPPPEDDRVTPLALLPA